MALTTRKSGDEIVHPQEDSDTGYLSYMLRMWLKRDGKGQPVWCASLEEPGSRHTESFGDISTMFSFLQSRLDAEMHGQSGQKDKDELQGGASHE
jgi:hypothetical protein